MPEAHARQQPVTHGMRSGSFRWQRALLRTMVRVMQPIRPIRFPHLALVAGIIAGSTGVRASTSTDPITCLLVTSRDTNELVLVGTDTLDVAARVTVGDGPHEVVVSHDGRRAFVSNYGHQTPGHTLSVIDVVKAAEIQRVDLGPLQRPHGLALSGSRLYLTAETNRAVARVDIDSLEVDWLMGIGADATHMLAATSDGERLFTTNLLSGTVTEVRTAGAMPLLRHLSVPGHPEGLALSPDGGTLWVGRNQTGQISVIDTQKWSVRSQFAAGQMPFRLRFSPNGRQVAVVDPPGGTVRLYDAATLAPSSTVLLPAPAGAAYSPDGTFLYAALLGSQSVAKVDTATGNVLRQAVVGPISDGVAIAPRRCGHARGNGMRRI